MRKSTLILMLFILVFCGGTVGSALAEHATAEPAEHAAAGEAAHGGGHSEEGHWTLFNFIPFEWTKPLARTVAGWFGITQINEDMYNAHGLLHVIIMFFVLILVILIATFVGGKYRKMLAEDDIEPKPGASIPNFIEAIVGAVLSMSREVIGRDDVKQYLPLLGSLTFVILFNNLLGLIPGFYVATDNWNTTLAMAIVVFLMYNYYGMKTHGVGKYLAHFMGPLEGKLRFIMAPIMVPIELISHIARPLSLSLRLLGNMFGDHKVFGVFMGLSALPLFYPLPFLALGLLVAIVQTLVFVLLSMVYISLATAHDH